MENQEVDLVEAMKFVESEVALAEAMQRLQNNPDFQLVFLDKFVRDWALTQLPNFAGYQAESRKGYMEQLVARSIFTSHIDVIVDNGRMAKEAMPEIRSEIDEMNKES